MEGRKYKIYSKGKHKLFETTNLNPCGKNSDFDGVFQVLKVLRPDLSSKEILLIIANEKIRRAEMLLDAGAIDKIFKENIAGYKPEKINKKYTLLELVDMCPSGRMIVRMGKDVVLYDADSGEMFSGNRELYAGRPVSAYWMEVNSEKDS